MNWALMRKNLLWGIGWGVAVAVVYALIAAALFLFRGQEPFRNEEVTVGATILGYFA